MAVHVAIVRLVNVNSAGGVVNKDTATVGQVMKSAGSEQRVYPAQSSSAPNATGNTITDYLIAEDAAGFNLLHMDQTYIITSNV